MSTPSTLQNATLTSALPGVLCDPLIAECGIGTGPAVCWYRSTDVVWETTEALVAMACRDRIGDEATKRKRACEPYLRTVLTDATGTIKLYNESIPCTLQ